MKSSYDNRIVRYEEIHSIKQEHFDLLCSLVDPKDKLEILDLGSGYGSCTRELIKKYPKYRINYTLTDNSDVQIQRSKAEIPQILKACESNSIVNYEYDDIVRSKFQDNSFDIVISKMVIHEIKKEKQIDAFKEIYRILKPGGKLIFWDLYLNNYTQAFFQEIVKEKDRLCGYETLYNNRYFLRGDEIFKLLKFSNFQNIQKVEDILTPVITSNRLKSEFRNNIGLLNEWHSYISEKAKLTDPFILFNLSYRSHGDWYSITPPKAIITAIKQKI